MEASCFLTYQWLMARARDPSASLTHAFAGVLARFRTLGIESAELGRLLARHFPGGEPLAAQAPVPATACPGLRDDEVDDVRALLLDHRADDTEETRWLAHTMATACLGDNHLWQDMGLPNREALSELLRRYYPALYTRNSGNMKWKKFFYKQLCERAEINICKAPSCRVCTDYVVCFGPER
jgi:nitrogen fixation protein NifQ